MEGTSRLANAYDKHEFHTLLSDTQEFCEYLCSKSKELIALSIELTNHQ